MSRSAPFGVRVGIGRLYRRTLGISACLLALVSIVPARADPFFVTVYGRTYKVDPRYPSNESQGPKPQEALRALPPDMARGPGFRPSHEQVLAEVEERVWIARHQLEDALVKTAAPREGGQQRPMGRQSRRRSRGRSRPERRRSARRKCKGSTTATGP